MEDSTINRLLEDLKNSDEEIRNQATYQLWQHWFMQKGAYGMQLLQHSQQLLDAGQIDEAEALLTDIINQQPDFHEAWNRRAVLYYLSGDFHKSIEDCEQVLKHIPYHFGAWHGLGLCYAAMGEFRQAIKAFKKALEIQPHALINQRLILECTAKLS